MSTPPEPTEPAEPAVELDCRGRPCPQPVIELARHLTDVEVGSLLAVVATDPAARHDVPAWCRMRGQAFVGSERLDDGAERHVVRRVS